jgi:hypothetical protein
MNASRYTTRLVAGVLLLAMGVFAAGCDFANGDFLEEEPKGSLSGGVVENQKGVETLLIGAYSALSPTDGGTVAIAGNLAWTADPSHWPYGAVSADVAQKGSVPNDQTEVNLLQTNRFDPTNGYFDGLWSNRFEGVSRANGVLETLRAADDVPPSEASRIAGEARFLRAYFYFDLKKNFDNVPWIPAGTDDFNQPNNVNEEIIWPEIENDLRFAIQNLPETQSDQARANKWAAAAFLGKAHVFQGEWDAARAVFSGGVDSLDIPAGGVIENGVTASGVAYDLTEEYSANFNAVRQGADNPEIVFSVEMTGEDGSGDIPNSWAGYKLNYPHGGNAAPFGCCGFFLASHDLVNSYKTTAEGLPRPDGFGQAFNGMDAVLKNDQGLAFTEQYTPPTDASLDPRLDWTVGRRGVPFHDHGPHPGKRYIRGSSSNYAGPYSTKKHIWRQANASVASNPNSWAPGTAVDYPSMRFAGVLLLAAEAEINGGGSMSQALEYVNRVRERAANPDGFVDNSMNAAFAAATISDDSELTSLDVSQNDWVVDEGSNSTFVLIGSDPSDMSNWNEYPNPADNYNVEPYTMAEFTSGAGALRKVHFERKLELALEGHRLYDLIRWNGRWSGQQTQSMEQRMNGYFDYQGGMTNDVEGASFQHDILPIPQTQIDNSTQEGEPVLTQNPQYQ